MIQCSKFAVDEKPFCMWEGDKEYNLEFINSIDPGYFQYLADHHAQALESDEYKQYAAISLRTAYSQGLETLFAFLFAAIQAPYCVVGWLHKYQVSDITSLLQKVNNWRPVLSMFEIKVFTWETISDIVLAHFGLEDKEKEARIKKHFATTWDRFADDFLKDSSRQEYNSVKHGLRVKPGGFTLAIGREDTYGVPAPPERMQSFGGSDFGSSFLVPEKIEDCKQHFCVRKFSRNWHPESFIYGLHIISLSLQNIISFIKICNGIDPTTVKFYRPSDESDFQKAWKPRYGISEMNLGTKFTKADIELFSKDEILDIYKTGCVDSDVSETTSTEHQTEND